MTSLSEFAALQPPVAKGDAPLTDAQLSRLLSKRLAYYLPEADRLALQVADPEAYAQVAAGLMQIRTASEQINGFNRALVAYRAAVTRLARYRLADGCPERVEDQETGEIDPETGEPLTAAVVMQPAVAPLPPTVAGSDPETGEPVEVPNPAIILDDAERAEAQAVIDATPQEVKDYDDMV